MTVQISRRLLTYMLLTCLIYIYDYFCNIFSILLLLMLKSAIKVESNNQESLKLFFCRVHFTLHNKATFHKRWCTATLSMLIATYNAINITAISIKCVLYLSSFSPSPMVRMSFWTLTIGRMFGWLPWYAVLQTSVQRYCSVPTLQKARV